MFKINHRPRCDAVQHEGSEQHGRGGAARYAEIQQRYHGAAHAGIVGDLRGQHCRVFALTESFRVFGCIFGSPVGNPGGNILTDSRNRADADTDQGGSNNFGDVF